MTATATAMPLEIGTEMIGRGSAMEAVAEVEAGAGTGTEIEIETGRIPIATARVTTSDAERRLARSMCAMTRPLRPPPRRPAEEEVHVGMVMEIERWDCGWVRRERGQGVRERGTGGNGGGGEIALCYAS